MTTFFINGVVLGGTVGATDTVEVDSGGNAVNFVLDGALEEVFSGGIANGTRLNAAGTLGGTLEIYRGGLAENTVVGEFGSLLVEAGGTAYTIEVSQFGNLEVASGGIVAGAILDGGAELEFGQGVQIDVETLDAGAMVRAENVVFSGSGVAVTVAPIGAAVSGASYGGTGDQGPLTEVDQVTITGGAQVNLASGGREISAAVVSGGLLVVLSGGQSDADVISSGGTEQIDAGGLAEQPVVQSGGTVTLLAGGALADATLSAGAAFIASGLTLNDPTATLTVAAITATLAGVFVGNGFAVSDVTLASHTSVGSGGTLTVASGGRSVDSLITVSGLEQVSGGTTTGSELLAGTQTVAAGGIASATRVGIDATLLVVSGGTASDATVSGINAGLGLFFSAFLAVSSGGVALATSALAHGRVTVAAGGVVSDTALGSAGALYVSGISGGGTGGGGVSPVSGPASAVSTTIDAGGGETVQADGRDSFATVLSGGVLTVASGGSSFASLIDAGGLLAVQSGGTASGAILSGGGTLAVQAGAALTGELGFAGAGNMLVLDGTATPAAALSGFAPGDSVDYATVAYVSGATASFADNTITVQDGATTLTLNVAPGASYAPGALVVKDDGHGETELLACFCPGTRIATPEGWRAVEDLCVGDLVMTQDGPLPVRFLGVQTVATRFADPLTAWPVRIRAGALGAGLPARDLLLSPGHAVLLDGVLVNAGALVDGVFVVREPVTDDTFQYYHVELDRHALLLAEGVPAESFLDMAEPVRFDNAAARPALPPAAELPYPRVKSARQLPPRLRGRAAA